MIEYIKYTPEVARDWKQAQADVQKDYPEVLESMTLNNGMERYMVIGYDSRSR